MVAVSFKRNSRQLALKFGSLDSPQPCRILPRAHRCAHNLLRSCERCIMQNFPLKHVLTHQVTLKGRGIRRACRTSTNYKYLKPFDPHATPKVEFEVSSNPEEWKYVERLLPPKCVPTPQPKPTYLSDWKPPTPEATNHPYFVPRNRNHMIPVYLLIRKRGQQRITLIKRIKGDIWAVEKELRDYLRDKCNKEVGLRIDELAGNIKIRGDFVFHAKNWCIEKGF